MLPFGGSSLVDPIFHSGVSTGTWSPAVTAVYKYVTFHICKFVHFLIGIVNFFQDLIYEFYDCIKLIVVIRYYFYKKNHGSEILLFTPSTEFYLPIFTPRIIQISTLTKKTLEVIKFISIYTRTHALNLLVSILNTKFPTFDISYFIYNFFIHNLPTFPNQPKNKSYTLDSV